MKAYLLELMSHYRALEKREQIALLSLSVFLLSVFLYMGIWLPANNYVKDSQVGHDRNLQLLTYLKSTESLARTSTGNTKGKTGGESLLSSVSRSAQSVGINPSRLQPEGSEAVSVWFDAVAFTKLMLWLERLESGQAVVVRQITIDRREKPGEVSARLVLRN